MTVVSSRVFQCSTNASMDKKMKTHKNNQSDSERMKNNLNKHTYLNVSSSPLLSEPPDRASSEKQTRDSPQFRTHSVTLRSFRARTCASKYPQRRGCASPNHCPQYRANSKDHFLGNYPGQTHPIAFRHHHPRSRRCGPSRCDVFPPAGEASG